MLFRVSEMCPRELFDSDSEWKSPRTRTLAAGECRGIYILIQVNVGMNIDLFN